MSPRAVEFRNVMNVDKTEDFLNTYQLGRRAFFSDAAAIVGAGPLLLRWQQARAPARPNARNISAQTLLTISFHLTALLQKPGLLSDQVLTDLKTPNYWIRTLKWDRVTAGAAAYSVRSKEFSVNNRLTAIGFNREPLMKLTTNEFLGFLQREFQGAALAGVVTSPKTEPKLRLHYFIEHIFGELLEEQYAVFSIRERLAKNKIEWAKPRALVIEPTFKLAQQGLRTAYPDLMREVDRMIPEILSTYSLVGAAPSVIHHNVARINAAFSDLNRILSKDGYILNAVDTENPTTPALFGLTVLRLEPETRQPLVGNNFTANGFVAVEAYRFDPPGAHMRNRKAATFYSSNVSVVSQTHLDNFARSVLAIMNSENPNQLRDIPYFTFGRPFLQKLFLRTYRGKSAEEIKTQEYLETLTHEYTHLFLKHQPRLRSQALIEFFDEQTNNQEEAVSFAAEYGAHLGAFMYSPEPLYHLHMLAAMLPSQQNPSGEDLAPMADRLIKDIATLLSLNDPRTRAIAMKDTTLTREEVMPWIESLFDMPIETLQAEGQRLFKLRFQELPPRLSIHEPLHLGRLIQIISTSAPLIVGTLVRGVQQPDLPRALRFLNREGIIRHGAGKALYDELKNAPNVLMQIYGKAAQTEQKFIYTGRLKGLSALQRFLCSMDPMQRKGMTSLRRVDSALKTDPEFKFTLARTSNYGPAEGKISFEMTRKNPRVLIDFAYAASNNSLYQSQFRLGIDNIIGVKGIEEERSREHVLSILIHLDGADKNAADEHYVKPWLHNRPLTQLWSYSTDPDEIRSQFRQSMERWIALLSRLADSSSHAIERDVRLGSAA